MSSLPALRRAVLMVSAALIADLAATPADAQGPAARASFAAPIAPRTLAITDVTVIPMTRPGMLEGQTVIVRDGRIQSIRAARFANIPREAVRIDGRGKFLIPGLAEMHGHIPAEAGPAADRTMFLFLASGVTTVRGMLGSPGQLAMRDMIGRGEMLGPTLVLSGPAMNGGRIATPQQGRDDVQAQKAAGYEALKIHEGLSRETYDTIVAAARAAGLRFGGHVPDSVGVLHALASGQASIDHLDGYTESVRRDSLLPPGATGDTVAQKVAILARMTREAKTSVAPTLALWEKFLAPDDSAALAARPELRYMPRAAVAQWFGQVAQFRAQGNAAEGKAEIALRDQLLRAMRDSGVRIVLATDAPQIFSVPGFSMFHEMRSMSRAGLTPWDILASGTRYAADYFLALGEWGTVEPGKRADLVLLDANPLTDIQNLRRQAGVIVRGSWLPRSEIEARLKQLEESLKS